MIGIVLPSQSTRAQKGRRALGVRCFQRETMPLPRRHSDEDHAQMTLAPTPKEIDGRLSCSRRVDMLSPSKRDLGPEFALSTAWFRAEHITCTRRPWPGPFCASLTRAGVMDIPVSTLPFAGNGTSGLTLPSFLPSSWMDACMLNVC